MSKRILITGATGMIGSAICRVATSSGYEVTCLVRKKSSRISNLNNLRNIKIIECSIDEYKNLKLDFSYDIFIHLAWNKTFGNQRDDVQLQLNNIQFTLDAVELAKRCKCKVFIGAGSQAEYGIKKDPLTSEMEVNPESGYGIAKYTAGKLAKMACKQAGIRFNWLRILSVYGINDATHTLISYVINELKAKQSPELTKCEQIWDYLYCDDAANAFLAVAEKGINGKIYPLGSGNGRVLKEYILDIQQIINPNIKLKFGKKEYYEHQPMFLVADISELTKDTGWKPTCSFGDGIKRLL